jgi:hypothetical protein
MPQADLTEGFYGSTGIEPQSAWDSTRTMGIAIMIINIIIFGNNFQVPARSSAPRKAITQLTLKWAIVHQARKQATHPLDSCRGAVAKVMYPRISPSRGQNATMIKAPDHDGHLYLEYMNI